MATKKNTLRLRQTREAELDIYELRDMLSRDELNDLITDEQVLAYFKKDTDRLTDLFYDITDGSDSGEVEVL